MIELRYYAKFRRNHSYHDRDISIFRFVEMATAAILDFWNYKFLMVGRVMNVELCQISWWSVKPLPRYRDFVYFNMSAAAIFDF